MSAGAILPFVDYLPAQISDRSRNFSICRLPPGPSLICACCQLTDREVLVYGQEYSRGLRYEMQASFRHQAHCLSASEFGRLADNRRMHRIANTAVFHVHTREDPVVNVINTSLSSSHTQDPPAVNDTNTFTPSNSPFTNTPNGYTI